MIGMKKIFAFFLAAVMVVLMCACGANGVKKSTNGNAEEELEPEKTNYCFYLKGDVLYFVESKTMKPVKLTDNFVTEKYEGYHSAESVRSKEGLVFAYYSEELNMVFYPDNGVGDFIDDLYCKDLSDPDTPGVKIAENVSCQSVVVVPEKKTVYYIAFCDYDPPRSYSPDMYLYSYDLDSGTSELISPKVSALKKSEVADIEFSTTDGTWYYKSVGEDAVPTGEKSEPADLTKGIVDSDFVKSNRRDIVEYDSGEKYYFNLDRDSDTMVLCFEDSKGVKEIYSHKMQNYHAISKKDSPCIAVGFSGDLVIANGKDVTEITDSGINSDFSFNSDKTQLFFLEKNKKSETALCRIPVNAKNKNKKQEIASNLKYFGSLNYNYCVDGSDGVYYVSKSDESLYYNDKLIDHGSVENIYGFWNNKLIYETSPSDGEYALLYAADGKTNLITDSIKSVCKSVKALWMITDYDSNNYTGDLCLYKNGKLTKVDGDIVAICTKCVG